jgi:hypothetical protein
MSAPDEAGARETGTSVEVVRGGRNVLTGHPAEAYPGLRVVRPGKWEQSLIVPSAGQGFVALGGEKVYAYETVDGGRAHGFELRPGDQATVVSLDLPFAFAEWHIKRASPKPAVTPFPGRVPEP